VGPTLEEIAESGGFDESASIEDGEHEVFEVDEILKYWRDDDGEECFLVKWYGFPLDAATWEPLEHLGSGCLDFIHEARSLYEIAEHDDGNDNNSAEDEAGAEDRVAPESINGGLESKPDDEDDFGMDPEGDIPQINKYTSDDNPALKRIAALLGGSDETENTDPVLGGSDENVDPDLVTLGDEPDELVPPSLPPAKRTKLQMPLSDVKPIEEVMTPGLCRLCQRAQNREEAPNDPPRKVGYVCPLCRLKRVDEFHSPAGMGLLSHCFASSPGTVSLSFTPSQLAQWRKNGWSVSACAVSLKNSNLGGPAWPHQVQARLNGKPCFEIDPPPHLHVRREQCHNITSQLRAGVNKLDFRFTSDPEKPARPKEERYCIGVILTREQSIDSLVEQVRQQSQESATAGDDRIKRILAEAMKKQQRQKDCVVTGTFGRSMKPTCPVSCCPIEEPVVGKFCQHIQVFDLKSYVSVNHGIRSLDKCWNCPVCSQNLRPDDLILDHFTLSILDSLRGQEDLVESIVFDGDASWEVEYYPTRSPGGSFGSQDGGGGNDSIALSETESE